jgi:hypothetical protein
MVILYHALYIVLFYGKLHVIPTFEFIGDQETTNNNHRNTKRGKRKTCYSKQHINYLIKGLSGKAADIEAKIKQLKLDLAVNKTLLSSHRRKHVSITDNRPSANRVVCSNLILGTCCHGY